MSQCVPSWDLEDAPAAARHFRRSSAAPDHVPMLDYDEVAELTWENGQLAMHGLGPPRSNVKLLVSASGTLESIVNQATSTSTSLPGGRKPSLFPWFEMDAMVPCSKASEGEVGRGKRGAGTSKQGRVGMAVAPEWSGSATLGRESQRVRVDRYEATSLASGGNTRTTTGDDQDDSVCHRRGNKKQEACDDEEVEVEVEKSRSRSRSRSRETCGKFSINSTKRSRAAAIHNQSERKRRDKINQRMKTLQKLVPNSSKTDKASMLDEVIEYLKQLQAQVQMMSRFMINVPHMMALSQAQHQLHMPMMTPMGMGMGMAAMGMSLGLGMGVLDIVALPTPLLPNSFIPITASSSSWDATQPDRLHPADPLSTFLACHPHPHHPITMDAYTRLQAAMYHHQLQQNPPPPSSSKNS